MSKRDPEASEYFAELGIRVMPADAERLLEALADIAHAAQETLELHFPMRGKVMIVRPTETRLWSNRLIH